jgi:hypothetical protein
MAEIRVTHLGERGSIRKSRSRFGTGFSASRPRSPHRGETTGSTTWSCPPPHR